MAGLAPWGCCLSQFVQFWEKMNLCRHKNRKIVKEKFGLDVTAECSVIGSGLRVKQLRKSFLTRCSRVITLNSRGVSCRFKESILKYLNYSVLQREV